MSSFWERLFGRGEGQGTGKQAKSRLQFVLLHDRLAIAPEKMEEMKAEILDVIRKYITVDAEHFDIALQRRESASLLVAEIPFLRMESGEADEDSDAPVKPAEATIKRSTRESKRVESEREAGEDEA
jgi:cell division topological specificity factor